MSGTSDRLARKIAAARETGVVVRSMKALAASSITQYETAVLSLDEYHRTLERALSVCLRGTHSPPQPSSPRRRAVVGVIVFGSDLGLVGRFNETLWEFAAARLKAVPARAGFIWAVGDRMRELVAEPEAARGPVRSFPGSMAGIAPLVNSLLVDLEAALARGEAKEVLVFHHRPKSAASYEPVQEQLLPLDERWQLRIAAEPWPNRCLPDILGSAAAALEGFTREYLFISLFRACAESLCSENASRLAAMQRAEKSIDELSTSLQRRFQRLRQEAIDEELFDVIAGFEPRA
jgi:F-type H+-transporting ATPase subunit gamma